MAIDVTRISWDRREGFSSHADRSELVRWVRGFQRSPAKTNVVHGEAAPARSLATALARERLERCRCQRRGDRRSRSALTRLRATPVGQPPKVTRRRIDVAGFYTTRMASCRDDCNPSAPDASSSTMGSLHGSREPDAGEQRGFGELRWEEPSTMRRDHSPRHHRGSVEVCAAVEWREHARRIGLVAVACAVVGVATGCAAYVLPALPPNHPANPSAAPAPPPPVSVVLNERPPQASGVAPASPHAGHQMPPGVGHDMSSHAGHQMPMGSSGDMPDHAHTGH